MISFWDYWSTISIIMSIMIRVGVVVLVIFSMFIFLYM